MGSLILSLQEDIATGKKGATEILRTAKLISSKLDLNDISSWISLELNGYGQDEVPEYRQITGGNLQYFNPYRGWLSAGYLDMAFPVGSSISTIEELVRESEIILPLTKTKVPLSSFGGHDDYMINQFEQRVAFSVTPFKKILETVKDQILDWTTELEKRGVLGEGMLFDKKEIMSAQSHIFNIQNATGIFGNVESSNVQIYDYSVIHQKLKEHGVPQVERNKLENIMDELSKAEPSKKESLLEKSKEWIVKNQDFLGASASLIRKSLGLDKS
jgi:hypothetical protein